MLDWRGVVDDHGSRVYALAYRLLGSAADAEDAIQDAYLSAYRLSQRQQVKNWGALLTHLTTRRALDLLRRRPRTLPLRVDVPAERSSPAAALLDAELHEQLRTALGSLPARESEVFSLRYLAELSNAEIAEFLDLDGNGVAAALYRAREKLARLLSETQNVSKQKD
jgi:RNA polymerase sigma-70 factor (ECF subfamily)